MADTNKVVWSQGMFLRPQHFQQQDRHLEHLVDRRASALRTFGSGFEQLEIDAAQLTKGKLALRTARGVLPDGTPFDLPDEDPAPPPLNIGSELVGREIALALPLHRPGAAVFSGDGRDDRLARYEVDENEVGDVIAGSPTGDAKVPVRVGRLRLGLMAAGEQSGAYSTLGVARIEAVDTDGAVTLDETYVPPCLDYRVSSRLVKYLDDIATLLARRGDALAMRVTESGQGGPTAMNEMLRLQAINRFEPLFTHLRSSGPAHPEACYLACVQLAGELATFHRSDRRPAALPGYQHTDLAASFAPLYAEIDGALSEIDLPPAVPLPLKERAYGMRVADVADGSLLEQASFVLTVAAGVPAETLRRQVPEQFKVGPRQRIQELVNGNLPGIDLVSMPVAPRQVPLQRGAVYFEFDRGSALWSELASPGGFGLYVPDGFPGLELKLWAIRGPQ